MESGYKLDKLVAEKVMGWKYEEAVYSWGELLSPARWIKDNGWPANNVPRYSEEIADAWLVVDKLKEKYIDINIGTTFGNDWSCNICVEGNDYSHVSETATLAICLAALKTVERRR